jgi:hypothetical protein
VPDPSTPISRTGSLLNDVSIDKDNPGSGVLIFEVPVQVCASESYLEFCPRRGSFTNEPHVPDDLDRTTDTVRWRLTR